MAIGRVCSVDLLGIRYKQQIAEQEEVPHLPPPACSEHHWDVHQQSVPSVLRWCKVFDIGTIRCTIFNIGLLRCCMVLDLSRRASPASQQMPQNSQSVVKHMLRFNAKG